MIVGAITGVLGSLVSKGTKLYEDSQNRKHEIKLLELQLKAKEEETEKEAKISAANIQVASYEHDIKIGAASTWVVNLLRLVRPSLTFYALGLLTVLWFTGVNEIPELRIVIVNSIVETVSMAIAWWFGDRSLNKK